MNYVILKVANILSVLWSIYLGAWAVDNHFDRLAWWAVAFAALSTFCYVEASLAHETEKLERRRAAAQLRRAAGLDR
jgi:hypothetical protein